MQQYKFDLDVIIRECERFDVKVEKGEGLRGMTMNGEEFDVAEVMELKSPDKCEANKPMRDTKRAKMHKTR